MALITWDDSYSVSVKEIDNQHKKLIGMVNEYHAAMKQGKGLDKLDIILDELVNYTVTHFEIEENYFDKLGYPETASHKKEHALFVQQVLEFKKGVENGNVSVSIKLMFFLMHWLEKHIKETDKKYTKFFNERGLK